MGHPNGLRALRLEKGWSQEQLATISGLSERTIQRVERGDTPSLETQGALAASFDLSPAQLRDLMHSEPKADPMSDTQAAPNPHTPEAPLLTLAQKRIFLFGALYLAALGALGLMQVYLGWDPELLPPVAIFGGGLLATYAFSHWSS